LSSQDFTVPDVGLSADLTVEDSDWIAVGQMVYLANGAGPEEAQAFKVTAKNGNVVTLWCPEPPGVAEIPLADSTEDGLMRRVSGLTTDFVNGTNSCTNLVNALTGAYLPLSGGTLTGSLSCLGLTSGSHTVNGNLQCNGAMTCTSDLRCGNNLYFANTQWRFGFDPSNGRIHYWSFDNRALFYYDPPGNQLVISGHCNVSGNVYAAAGVFNTTGSFAGVLTCSTDCNISGNLNVWGGTGYFGGIVSAGLDGLRTPVGMQNRISFHWNGANIFGNIDSAIGWRQLDFTSDARLKEDIAASTFDCLDIVLRLPLQQFRWKPTIKPEDSPVRDVGDKRTRMQARDGRTPLIPVGFVAQLLYQVFPEAVCKGDDGEAEPSQRFNWDVDKNTMLATLTGAIQQLSAKVESLEARVMELEGSPI
jgi:hypothetical protein